MEVETVLNSLWAASFYCVELYPMVMHQVNFGKDWVKIKNSSRLFSPPRDYIERCYLTGMIYALSRDDYCFQLN